jgi:uncharacterized Ntn-hydrolase superfamily protein
VTYSIVARDPATGQMGVAVQSHWFSVGSVVTWGQAGVGVVATQALVEPSYGPKGLERMAAGAPAPDALASLLAEDSGSAVRQVAMVDAQGLSAAHTGERCIAAAGHTLGDDFSCQANMMWNDTVWDSMAAGFTSAKGDLETRLTAALVAAESAKGDIRGRQSAAILVVGPEATGNLEEDRPLELRIEDHPDPITELKRLLRLRIAYRHAEHFDQALETGDEERAWREAAAAESLAPDNMEFVFWRAVAFATIGRVEEARILLARCDESHPGWPELLRRLPAAGLFPDDPDLIARLLPD